MGQNVFGIPPIAFDFPIENDNPVIIDMATSATELGKLLYAKKTDSDIRLGKVRRRGRCEDRKYDFE